MSRPANRTGDFLPLRWDYGDPEELYVYGHVDLPSFLAAVAGYLGGSVESLDFGMFPVLGDTVRHRWARFTFSGRDAHGNPTRCLREYREQRRGCFRVTAMTPERWLRFRWCDLWTADGDGVRPCWLRAGHPGPCQSYFIVYPPKKEP